MENELSNQRNGANVLDIFIDAGTLPDALETAGAWASRRTRSYVCFCNVHSIITASVRPDLARTLRQADMALPDGFPVAWALRGLGFGKQKRISGPDFMWEYCAVAEARQVGIYLYGNRSSTLERLKEVLAASFPRLRIVGAHSPPFRPLTQAEDDAVVREIEESGAGIVFVSLGCPKQELWMAAHRDRIDAVLLGVGAAFDYHAGIVRRPPAWARDLGFEWLYRLVQEPRRLWKRYLIANSIFVYRAAGQIYDHTLQRLSGPRAASRSEAETQEEGTAGSA